MTQPALSSAPAPTVAPTASATAPASFAPDFRAAWRAACLEREPLSYRVAALCFAGAALLSILRDRHLVPALAPRFAVASLTVMVLQLGLYVALTRARDLARCRALGFCASVIALALIAFKEVQVTSHNAIYALTATLLLWTIAVLFTWPIHYGLVAGGLLVLFRGGLDVAFGHPHSLGYLMDLSYYLGCSLLGAVLGPLVHRRMQLRTVLANLALAQRNQELAQTLLALREAQGRLMASEKLSALGRMLAQLSHELNNPLNVIVNNLAPLADYLQAMDGALLAARASGDAEVARRFIDDDLDFVRTDFAAALATMQEAAQRMRQVHQDLRAFTRGARETDLSLDAAVDLNAGLSATVALLRRGLPRGVEIKAALAPLPPVRCRAGQLNQVFHNLLGNALDAIGGAGTVQVESARRGDAVEISVSDTGPGVAAEARGHLFEPFFTTKGVGKGTGLGLATSYQIIKNHGGTLELDAAFAGGARFVIRLPVTAEVDGAQR